jgi:hypothetical protein
LAVAEGAAQGAHLNLQVRFFDECLRPGSGDQLLFADHLAGAFDQSSQDVKSPAAEPHRLVALEQEPLRCKEPVRAKRDCVFVHEGRVPGVTSLYSVIRDWGQSEAPPPRTATAARSRRNYFLPNLTRLGAQGLPSPV